ncbi:MAG: hypothetical protein ACFFCW_10665, partial [Candidatus Hodarchaeota archaeon]
MSRKAVTRVQVIIVGVVIVIAAVIGGWWFLAQQKAEVPEVLKVAMEVDITGLDPHFHGGFD